MFKRKLFKINTLKSVIEDSEYCIKNLDTYTIRTSDKAYIKEVVVKIQALDFIELVDFLDFHFIDLRPSLKVEFLEFINLYILDNDDIKTNYRDTIKKWYNIKDLECAIYKEDDPIYNWNKMVWNYEAFFLNCDCDFGIDQLTKELIDLKSDPLQNEYKEKKKEIEIKIKEASEQHKKEVRIRYNEKVKEQFGTICHRAEQELNRLLLNEKYDFLKSTVKPELLKIETEFMRLVKKFKMNNCQNVEYMHTFLQLNYFFEIKYWFDNVVLNIIEPSLDVLDSNEKNVGLNEEKAPFEPKIFKDEKAHSLFLYLVGEFAKENRPTEYSQIYRFLLQNENSIKPSTGKKYRIYVKEYFGLSAIFSRIDELLPYHHTTLISISGRFNKVE